MNPILTEWRQNMDFKDLIKQLSEKIPKLRDTLKTEEATKNALILPFLAALGYDVFDPREVLPEMSCDIGAKQGEKIDYAIKQNGKTVLLVECKCCLQALEHHTPQLLRYFTVSEARFAILTNGIVYRFYTDIAEPNKMDKKPFLEINLLDIKDAHIDALKSFHKSYFNEDNLFNSASELKYMRELKEVLSREFANPSRPFVKAIAEQIYEGAFTSKVVEQFTELVHKAVASHVNDLISARLTSALKEESKQEETPNNLEEEKCDIATTEEEWEGFLMVKAILRGTIPVERVTYRDAKTYFAIFIDGNNRKPVCRLYFNSDNKRIAFVDDEHKEERIHLNSLDDIYLYAERLKDAARRHLGE